MYEQIPEFIEANNILGVNAMRLERKAADVVHGIGQAVQRLILHVEMELDPNAKQYSDEPHTLVLPTMPARVLRVDPTQQGNLASPGAQYAHDDPTTLPVIVKEPEKPLAMQNPDRYRESDATGNVGLTTNPAEADRVGTVPADSQQPNATTDEHGNAYAVTEPKNTTPGLISSATGPNAATTPQTSDVTQDHLGQPQQQDGQANTEPLTEQPGVSNPNTANEPGSGSGSAETTTGTTANNPAPVAGTTGVDPVAPSASNGFISDATLAGDPLVSSDPFATSPSIPAVDTVPDSATGTSTSTGNGASSNSNGKSNGKKGNTANAGGFGSLSSLSNAGTDSSKGSTDTGETDAGSKDSANG